MPSDDRPPKRKRGGITLKRNRAEAIAMSIFEYDEEKHLKNEREHAYNEGKKKGRAEGKAEGRVEEIVAMGREFGLDDAAILQKLQEKGAGCLRW